MDYKNSIYSRRQRFINARLETMNARKNRLKNHADTLTLQRFERNEVPNGVTPEFRFLAGLSNFNNPVLASNSIADSGLYDNEPVRIQALRAKGRNQPLSQKEKEQLQRYYYMQDSQAYKDNRYILNESYKIGKKFF